MTDPRDTAVEGEPAEERIRFCLACGEPAPFDEPTCPACGHAEPAARDEGPACVVCGHQLGGPLTFCPSCGARQATLVLPAAPAGEIADPPDTVERLALVLVVVTPLVAAAAVLMAYGFAPR